MGSKEAPWRGTARVPGQQPKLLSVQAWHILDRTHITAFMTYDTPEGPVSHNLGNEALDYQLLALPTLGQVIWCLGDEIRESWRELSGGN